jgi:hypothetical protein
MKSESNTEVEEITNSVKFKHALSNFLRCRTKEGDNYLTSLIQALVRAEGGIHSNGAFMVSNGKEWVSVPTATKCTTTLISLVNNTTTPVESGGQGSDAVLKLLRAVSERLYSMAETEFKHIKRVSEAGKLEIGDGETATEVGERICYYMDPTLDKKLSFSPHALTTNMERLQPDCCTLPWFVTIALQHDPASTWTFDALDGSIRSGGSVVYVVNGEGGATNLAFRWLHTDDHMLLDTGHDISAIKDANAFFSGEDISSSVLELRTDMEEADKMWEEWFPDEKIRDFLMYTVAERMLLQVRKECFVFETPSDRGKSALLMCLLMLAGSYARLLPKAGLDGSNKRTARVHELTLSKSGVRLILHDEADRVDWEYLKAESNGTTGSEFSLGMGETLEVAYKAMRVITKNAARHDCTVEAAPIDVRRKIVHVTGDSMQPPTADAERYSRIKKGTNPGCPRLARGLFLSVMRVFHENAFRPAYPDALRAGSDLATQSSVNETDSNTLADTLSSRARAAFAESYRVVAKTDTGTESSVVQKQICEKLNMSYMTLLPVDAFLGSVLRAGCNSFNGDKIQVPEDARGYVMKDGKRQRLHHVMPVVSAPA